MIEEDYVSSETAKLLKEKGFDEDSWFHYDTDGGIVMRGYRLNMPEDIPAWTLQMAMKWLRKTHGILLIVDYDYECTDTSYYYKIYRLGKHGKPERVAVKGVSYAGTDGHPVEHTVGYRDYERSYKDYKNPEEACDEGIRHCLENLI